MKWKRKVTVITEQGNTSLCLGDSRCPVPEADLYLVEAIRKGIHEDDQLKKLIMEHDSSNEIVAGFTLAKFILDYQSYLEEDRGYYEITM
jgi:hypothetical protein